jgi:cytochrome P450
MNHGFHGEALTSYYPSFVELTEKAIATLPVNEDTEISDFFSRHTLDVLGKTIFNHDFGRIERQDDKYYQAYEKILDTLFHSFWGLLLAVLPQKVLEKVPIRALRDFNDSIDILVQFFGEMIEQHKGNKESTVLSKLLTGVESSEGPSLTRTELISNIWIFFVAGHETTTSALTYACNCLRAYPDIQEKLFREIESKIGLDKIPTEEDLNQLTYLDCFINEVSRLHPAVTALGTREATEDIQYKDQIIPKGAALGICFQAVHTNPEYWEDPQTFNPDRFLPENKKGRNRFLHIPFSAGPRQCIGTNFSLVEQRLFLTRLLQQYRIVDPVKKAIFPKTKNLIFGAKNELYIRLEKR